VSEFEFDMKLHGSESEYASEFESGSEFESDLNVHFFVTITRAAAPGCAGDMKPWPHRAALSENSSYTLMCRKPTIPVSNLCICTSQMI
jgi:hypothetical protein